MKLNYPQFSAHEYGRYCGGRTAELNYSELFNVFRIKLNFTELFGEPLASLILLIALGATKTCRGAATAT